MEGVVGVRAMGTAKRSFRQMKLTEVYRLVKKTPDVGKQGKGGGWVCEHVVRPEPVDWCESEKVVVVVGKEKEPEVVMGRSADVHTFFPGMMEQQQQQERGGVVLQQVKVELLSPGSCVTNENVFCDAAAMGDGEILSTDVTIPPHVKSLVTVVIPHVQNKRLLSPASSDSSTLEVSTAVPMVKAEPVEPEGKLVIALNVSAEEAGPSAEAEPHGKVDSHARPEKVMGMAPTKHVTMEEVGCEEEMCLVPSAHVQSGLVHVKSEPVESSEETGVGGFRVLERVALQKKVPELVIPELHLKFSENGQSSSCGSQGSGETEEECLPTQACSDGVEDIRETATQESQKEVKNRNSNPGRRIQGGRIYDSSLGRTCHWCRQKTVEHHVKCRECTIYYCGPCLVNRNGENVMEELAEGARWLCPRCRNGCGPGCDNCCNCGPCRKASGKAPTGQLIREARNAGFLNVHDYLVHLETGETPEEVAKRKVGREWTNCGRFEWKDASESSEDRDEPSSSEGTDDFTLNEETSTQLHEGKIGMKVLKRFLQSQKRKGGAMRGALPAKRSQVEGRRQDVDSILASLKPSGEKSSKGKEMEVEDARVEVQKEESALRFVQPLGSQSGGMRACKREYVEMSAGGSDVGDAAAAKRRKTEEYSGDQRHALLSELMLGSSSFGRVKCEVEPSSDNSNEAGPRRKFTGHADAPGGGQVRRPSKDCVADSELHGAKTGVYSAASQQMFEQRGLDCPSDFQGTEYRTKLKSVLAQPFDAKELDILEESAKCRKPVQRLRQMRGRIVDVVTEDEGFSYLDHHQDFASKLEEAQSPPVKLALLRGFFFWLQHSCMEGAFRPWPGALTEARPQSEDCMETDGPDCQVTAVVLPLDEGRDALHRDESYDAHHRPKSRFTRMEQRPLELGTNRVVVCEPDMTSNPLGFNASSQALVPFLPNPLASRQGLLQFQARKNPVQHVKLPRMKGQVTAQPGMNYRVVLGLRAPSLSKN